jgi:hypothetical protein
MVDVLAAAEDGLCKQASFLHGWHPFQHMLLVNVAWLLKPVDAMLIVGGSARSAGGVG